VTSQPPSLELQVGQVWRHKRELWRRVEIFGLRSPEWGGGAFVKRNTSRRRQAISEETLRRDYELVRGA
jgi:hypothetical protein